MTFRRMKGETMTGVVSILNALPWFAWIAIVAIVCGTTGDLLKRSIKHRERMAMIRQGMNPDAHAEKVHSYEHCEEV
jgi:hypothetical protein